MTDHLPHLLTIESAADPTGALLVYADWLEERGEPLGEFIRLGAELAKPPKTVRAWRIGMDPSDTSSPYCTVTESRTDLLRRRDGLIIQHHRTWTAGLDNDPRLKWEWSGGFATVTVRRRMANCECRRGIDPSMPCTTCALDPTAVLMGGGECPTCGRIDPTPFLEEFGRRPLCVDCGGRNEFGKARPGSGRTPGLAAALGKLTVPLQVGLEGKQPYKLGPSHIAKIKPWVWDFQGDEAAQVGAHCLPDCLKPYLEGCQLSITSLFYYESNTAALAACHRAAALLCRQAAAKPKPQPQPERSVTG